MDQPLHNLVDTVCDNSMLTSKDITDSYIYFAEREDMSFRFYMDSIIGIMRNLDMNFERANSYLMIEFIGG